QQDEVLAKLMEVSKALEEIIRISTKRKIHMDNLIKSMTKDQESEAREEEEAGNEEADPKT
ncbi:hypothetical protein A2U01_0064225, partial [Trifolium medium]|nr:hypothetical protein [Trifolium medium]